MVCLSFYGFYSPFVSTAALFVKIYLNKRLIIPFLLSSQKEAIGNHQPVLSYRTYVRYLIKFIDSSHKVRNDKCFAQYDI